MKKPFTAEQERVLRIAMFEEGRDVLSAGKEMGISAREVARWAEKPENRRDVSAMCALGDIQAQLFVTRWRVPLLHRLVRMAMSDDGSVKNETQLKTCLSWMKIELERASPADPGEEQASREAEDMIARMVEARGQMEAPREAPEPDAKAEGLGDAKESAPAGGAGGDGGGAARVMVMVLVGAFVAWWCAMASPRLGAVATRAGDAEAAAFGGSGGIAKPQAWWAGRTRDAGVDRAGVVPGGDAAVDGDGGGAGGGDGGGVGGGGALVLIVDRVSRGEITFDEEPAMSNPGNRRSAVNWVDLANRAGMETPEAVHHGLGVEARERRAGRKARGGRGSLVMMRAVERLSPRDEGELLAVVGGVFGLRLPSRAMVKGNAAPGDYLSHAFFERRPGDCLVWANRGGGKTMMGALATLLDMLFKPGIRVRILGGSLEQSSKMYEHLVRFARTPGIRSLVSREPTLRSLSLVNGSEVEILAQSERSVRGTRVHKLRCDEVEEFRPEVWRAAQMVTRAESMRVEGVELEIGGTIEAMSTAHRATGLMSKLIAARGVRAGVFSGVIPGVITGEDRETASGARSMNEPRLSGSGLLLNADDSQTAPSRSRLVGADKSAALFRWCALDVIERCPPTRACKGCALWDECGGLAREADGFLKVEDVIRQRERISAAAWSSEMMCRRPRVEDGVYAGFDAEAGGKHVVSVQNPGDARNPGLRGVPLRPGVRGFAPSEPRPSGSGLLLNADKLQTACLRARLVNAAADGVLVAGVDFGIRSPMVMLWAVVRDGVIEVIDEYVARGMTLERNLDAAESRGHGTPAWVGIDPAGQSLNSQSGESDAAVLRRRGYKVRALRLGLREGVELVRARLDRQTLRIREGCVDLIESLATYHFDEARPANESPVKDGPDHVCDALRYLVQNQDAGASGAVAVKCY